MVDEMKHTATVGAAVPSSNNGHGGTRSGEQSYLFEYRRRIRGLLATIRAIVRRTARNNQSAEEYAAVLEGRLGALARVQDMLMRVTNSGADLLELVSAEFLAQGVPEDKVTLTSNSLALSSKVATSLALALHELTTNAIKFGALSAPQGRVAVSWRESEKDGYTHLKWVESGVPIVLTGPRTNGFGMELLEKTLPYELSARTSVEFAPGGLACLIEFRPWRGRAEAF
jgi:two-component system, chemotaxis family, CheB/CheR fusion protein